MYTVIEDEGPVRVCVNLTKPEGDIEEEMVFVESLDFPSSVYIPADATLASELLCLKCDDFEAIYFPPVPDPFNFLTLSYNMIDFSDYERQQLLSNRIRSIGINATRRIICYDQPIYDDMRLEVSEYFGMTLTVQAARTTLLTEIWPMYDQVAILILDDDGERAHYEATIIKSIYSEGIAHQIEQVFMFFILSLQRLWWVWRRQFTVFLRMWVW